VLAQQVAAELERAETLDPGPLNGTFDDTSTGYSWMADVAEADEQGLYPVHITVNWDNGTRSYDLYTSLRPHPLPPPATTEEPATNTPAGNDALPGDGQTPSNGQGPNNGQPTGRSTRTPGKPASHPVHGGKTR
jgi:hypothetical protein